MYQYKHNQLPISFINTYSYNYEIQPQRQTRRSHEIHIPNPQNEFTDTLPKYQFPKIGNNILDVQNKQKTLKLFVKQVKSDIVKSYSSYVNCVNPYCHHCAGS